MLRPYFFSTENGFLRETRFLLMDTPLIKGGRGDRHPPYQGGQGGSNLKSIFNLIITQLLKCYFSLLLFKEGWRFLGKF
ncbi:MAG: hypothetical protein EWV83_11800 [Microcystis sp. M_OC_Ca_00000000_S217Cul]|nr:MAG: hypothetical protein EWV83_11800 [Microcystis sp. M_OC_Ca_00000000_S217Cul]